MTQSACPLFTESSTVQQQTMNQTDGSSSSGDSISGMSQRCQFCIAVEEAGCLQMLETSRLRENLVHTFKTPIFNLFSPLAPQP